MADLVPLIELKFARMRAGLSQTEFAKKLGITRLAVLNIEVGRRSPSMSLALRWTQALGPHGHLNLFDPDWRSGQPFDTDSARKNYEAKKLALAKAARLAREVKKAERQLTAAQREALVARAAMMRAVRLAKIGERAAGRAPQSKQDAA